MDNSHERTPGRAMIDAAAPFAALPNVADE
jgi:hypothetical protein